MAEPAPARDTRADARRRRKARRAEQRDKAYLAWLAQFPCVACGARPVELHHEPPKSHAGAWHDRKTLPLCADHHRGTLGRHTLGFEQFQKIHRLDLRALIENFNLHYEGETNGRMAPY